MDTSELSVSDSDEAAGTGRRILLIEDSEVLARRLVDLLCEPGRFAVTARATTQNEALTQLQEALYDVLVVDIELAEGNGVVVMISCATTASPRAPITFST
ncbi:MAG: response regulator, partial [Gammaproteobacteria bacterium]